MTRIVETERRAAITRDDPYQPRRQQQTFTERYRGTEFDSPRTSVAETQPPVVSRGRTFVLVTGAAAIGFLGLIAYAALTA